MAAIPAVVVVVGDAVVLVVGDAAVVVGGDAVVFLNGPFSASFSLFLFCCLNGGKRVLHISKKTLV